MSNRPVLSPAQFYTRVTRLATSWLTNRGGAFPSSPGSLLIVSGDNDEDVVYSRTLASHLWLFGWELPGVGLCLSSGKPVLSDAGAADGEDEDLSAEDAAKVIADATGGEIVVAAMGKKAAMFEALAEARRPEGTLAWPIRVVRRSKETSDKEAVEALVSSARSTSGGGKFVVGTLTKEVQKGDFATSVRRALESAPGYETVNIADGISWALACKEDTEVSSTRNAAKLSTAVLKRHFVREMEKVIDAGKRVPHSRLAETTEQAILDPSVVKVSLNSQFVESCFNPIVQSGGKFDLRTSAVSDDDPLHVGTIVVRLGARYKSYCAGLARTYIIDPTPDQEAQYEALLAGHEAAMNLLRPGALLSDVHAGVVAAVAAKGGEDLAKHLTASFGFGMGLEFRDASYVIRASNTRRVRAGMVFHVTVGLGKLRRAEADGKTEGKDATYALMVGDTVVVREDTAAECLTTDATRQFAGVTYQIDEGAEDDADAAAGGKGAGKGADGSAVEVRGEAILAEKLRAEPSAEELRRKHQEELAARRREEAQRRYNIGGANGGAGGGGGGGAGGADDDPAARLRSIVAYKSVSEYPKDARMDRIHVDQRRDAVLLPVNGSLTPVHVSMVKRVTKVDESGYSVLRILFNTPDQGPRSQLAAVPGDPERNVYVKELSYRSANVNYLVTVMKQVNDLRKRFNAAQNERKEQASIVAQEDLQVLRGKNPMLRNVFIRPFPGRRAQGTLEAHANGLRFTPSRGDARIDIIFRNIKHAFFQPAENEAVVLIHFHLHNAVMIGKKASHDVQVYTEVMEQSQALEKSSKSRGHDYDEIEEEQREREVRQRLNENFQSFVKKLEDAIARNGIDLEFDIPYRELGFFGVPHKSMTYVMPSVHCLVELTEQPFFLVTLDEVEIVHLERVRLGLANFDIVFVLKDFDKTPVQINTVPMESLEPVKQWLDSSDIKYYEGRANLHWNKIMATIREDPAGFFEDGGWEFLDMEKPASDDEDDEDDESEFAPSESSSAEAESSSDEFSYTDESGSEEFKTDEEEELSEEGQDWDQLEKQAERDDRERAKRGVFGRDDDVDGGGGGGGGGSRHHHKKQRRR